MGLMHRFEREEAEARQAVGFDRFWALYPRKEAKIDAQKAWQQMTKQYGAREIIDGLERNLPAITAKERRFQKLPAGWLRDGRWMDEVEPQKQSTGNPMIDAMAGFQWPARH